eukprot:g3920.t1
MSLRLLASRALRARPAAARAFCAGPDEGIPTDKEQQMGRRGFEVQGGTFGRDPIWVAAGHGTKDNPAQVPSKFSQRTLGVDDPATQQLFWFNAKKGQLTYVSCIDKYFTIVDL